MGLIYHYTKFETFMSFIWPSSCIRTNFLRDMNDPRELLDWSFNGINLPYEELFMCDYLQQTHIDCQYRFGGMIKDKYQVLCFSGAKSEGWKNEMMWAHYGGLHSGIGLEFDEDILLDNLSIKYPEVAFEMENVDYSNLEDGPWINWQASKSKEQNMSEIPAYLVKEMVLTKSPFWDREDERRLACINSDKRLFIPIQNALKTDHFGVTFNKNGKEMVEAVFKSLDRRCNLSLMVYQHNRFERWGIKIKSDGKIGSCHFDDLL